MTPRNQKLIRLFVGAGCLAVWVANSLAAEPALDLALRAIKMTEHDLGFSKTNVESELVLAKTRFFLQNPLQLAVYGESVRSNCASVASLRELVEFSRRQLEVTGLPQPTLPPRWKVDPHFLEKLPPPVAQAVQEIASVAATQTYPTGNAAALAAFALDALHIDHDPAEIESWQRLGIDIQPLRQLLDRDERLELQDTEVADALLGASDKFSLPELMATTEHLAAAVDKAIALLRTNTFTGEFQYETDTPLGKIIVGGVGRNVYTNEAFLIIDLGGDDVYENSAGGANGLVGRPVSIVIDLAGNDQFISKRSFSQGSGVFGVGILAALGSNCTFQAKYFSQGAGFFGCGILMTGVGQQTFEADTFCQGAGEFGTGILWQRGGDTKYKAHELAQGFGGTQGVGLLLDVSGNDSYVAVGKEACPWLPGHSFTLSQGFGYGMRPFAGGGIGILCDLKGDDHYQADVYGQGASYWYSIGLLLDAEGNDKYDAYQYCQGAGIHLSNGALIDWAGNDTYTAHAICQGGAHDFSVGLLIDHAGDDKYTGDTTAQGAAINNSFAMLLDEAGNDTYIGTDPKQSQATGHDGGKREYGSIGVLLDLGGKDTYSQGQTNNTMWIKPFYGAGLDGESSQVGAPFRVRPAQMPITAARPPGRLYKIAPVDPNQPIEHLLRVATSDRPEAGKAWDELQAHAAADLPYLITRLASPNIMVRVKFEELVDHLGTNSIPLLIAGIRSTKDDEIARLCCYFLARFNEKAHAAIPVLLPLLKRPLARPIAFYTLGHLRAAEALRPALAAVNDPSEFVRLRATQALGEIGNRRAIPPLLHKLDDELYDVRYAAEYALVAFGPEVIGPLRHAYPKATPRAQPHILEAFAKLGDDHALPLAKQFYQADEPILRDAVLRSLTETLKQAQTSPPPPPAAAAK